MAAATIPEAKAAIINALPESGEVTYQSVYQALQSQGENLAIAQFHTMRRAKEFGARVAHDDGVTTLMIQRAPYSVNPTGGDS
jgi:hypothetical protein